MVAKTRESAVASDNVINLREAPDYVARCPECNSKEWEILLDGVGDDWETIHGTRCVACGFTVDWVICHRDHDDDS